MKKLRDALVCLAIGSVSATAQAGIFTPVLAPAPGEASHEQIFQDLFGPSIVQVGNDFTNGQIDLIRVDDDSDQVYDFESFSVEAQAVWAGASQSFGTLEDGILFDVEGDGQDVFGSVSGVEGGLDIVFARFGNELGTITVHTDQTLNPDGRDHVVTYRLTDETEDGPITSYFLFFEDLSDTSPLADWDFNDLVVELRGVSADQNPVIPEPGSLLLLGAGSLALLRRRR